MESDAAARPSLARLLAWFLRIGALGFGGGMAVIALMERELISRRRLLPLDEFLHGVGMGQMLGSFAVNAACFVGQRLYGPVGGALSAAAFLLPSVAAVTALSHLYFRYHAIPALDGAVAGVGPVVIALIVYAGWSIGRKVARSPAGAAIALAAAAAGFARFNAVWVLAVAGAAGLVSSQEWRARAGATHALGAALPLTFLPASPLAALATSFFKIGLVFIGGGFVLIPVLHQRLVGDLHWLTAREFMDGVAISNLTPGPIAVLSTFAGYHLAGVTGALVATAALMAPGTILMLLMGRQYGAYASRPGVRAFLGGVNPAIAGLVLSAAALLGRTAVHSWQDAALAALSLLAMARSNCPPALLLGCGAAAGYFRLLG